jgi:hypothetical protein
MRIASLVVGLSLWASGAAVAGEAVPATYHYRIRHQIFGEIGEHVITVSADAGAVVVEHFGRLAVKVLGFTAFERLGRYREVWRGERLVEFDGLTLDNGKRFAVRARAKGDRLLVDGPAGRIAAPGETAPSQPSLASAIVHRTFIHVTTGQLLQARVRDLGRETLELASGPVETEKYEVKGDLEQLVWYDAAGVFVQWRLWRQGAAITLTRE